MSYRSLLILAALVCALAVFHMTWQAQAAEQKEAPAAEEQKKKNRVPGPPITPSAWPGGTAMPTGKLAVVDHMTFSSGKLRKGSSSYTNRTPSGAKVGPKSNQQWTNTFKLRYGLAWNRLDIRTATPFINNDIRRHSPKGGTWKGGLGDTTVMLRYQVLPRTDEFPFCVAVDAGVIVPTGHTGDKDKYLATNAFGTIFGAGASWIDHNQRFDIDGRYVFYQEGKHDIKPGDYALFHAHYAYAVSDYFDLGVEGFLRVEQAREIDGKSQRDAFTEMYAGPKMQIKVPEWNNFMLGAAVLLPVYRHYDAARMSADARFEFRAGILF